MTYVVELVEEELTVQPIHRLFEGLPADDELLAALGTYFLITPTDDFGPDSVAELVERGSLGLVRPNGCAFLHPIDGAFDAAIDLDTVRLEVVREELDPHEVRYQHGVANVMEAVAEGTATFGILGRPATIAQIQHIAHGGDRMPPKTTFFAPKPPTGIVFRSLD